MRSGREHWKIAVEVRQGTLAAEGRGHWRREAPGDEGGRRRRRRRRRRRGGKRKEEGRKEKANNPQLTGAEKHQEKERKN